MTKAELINAVAEESGLSKIAVKQAIDAFITVVPKTLATGDKIALVGFGTFSVQERGARMGMNPATKQMIAIPAKKAVKFKPGAEMVSAVTGKE